jgi:hypothetical protein
MRVFPKCLTKCYKCCPHAKSFTCMHANATVGIAFNGLMQPVKFIAPLVFATLTVATHAQAVAYRTAPQHPQPMQQHDLRSTLRQGQATAVAYPHQLSPEQRAELRRQLSQQNRRDAVRH